jgi:hypothetical protein
MADLPAGTDRNTLVVVRPKELPEGVSAEDAPTHVVGVAWLQAFPEDFEFLRLDGETEEQATAREEAAAAAAAAAEKPAKTTTPPPRTDAFA